MARRRRRACLWSVLLLGLLFASAPAGAAILHSSGLTLETPDGREVDPGELVTYCFILRNETSAAITARISFAASMDWPLLGEAGELAISPGAEEAVVLSVMVPADALARSEHRLELTVAWDRATLTGAVVTVVRARHELQLTGPKPVTAAPGSTVDLSFSLGNTGNTAETCRLAATSAQGWPLSPAATELELGPNEVTSIHFRLTIPVETPERATDTVTVTVTSESGRTATAAARVQVGQPVLEGVGRIGPESHRFTGEMGLALDSPGDYLGPPDSWLRLSGPIGAKERMELILSGQFSPETYLDLSLFQYQAEGYRIRAGNLTSPWTGLVSPGTGRAGLDAVFEPEGGGRFSLTLGIPSGAAFTPEVAWYGLGWTGTWADWELGLRYLKNTAGINRDELGYLDASFRRRAGNSTFSADLAAGLTGGSHAGLLQYWNTKESFSWRTNLFWSDELNRPNEESGLGFGIVIPFPEKKRLAIELGTAEESGYTSTDPDLPSIAAARTYELKLSLAYETGWTLRTAAKEMIPLEGGAGRSLEHRLGFTYTRGNLTTLPSWRLEGELARAADEADSWAPDHTLAFGGTYRFRAGDSPGTWLLSLYGSLSTYPGSTSFETGHLRPALAYEARLPAKRLSYRVGIAEDLNLDLTGNFTAEARLDWGFGPDTSLSARATLEDDGLAVGLQMVHRFGMAIPRPHATITGLVYQDLDGDGAADPEEPGIPGAWVTLDGARAVRTAADGRWTMTGVPPGDHRIEADCDFDPAYRSRLGPVAVAVRAGDSAQVSFPVWRLTTLAGRVFVDRDRDGACGPADRPLGGALVMLARPDGSVEKAAAAPDGFFSFPDLEPGAYRLSASIEGELAEEVAAPEEIAVTVAQEGYLSLDLIAGQKEKPVVVTFVAPPSLTATANPLVVRRGETLRLDLQADVPLSRVEVELEGGPVWSWPVDESDHWSGEIAIPSDCPLGPASIILRAWDSGETPGETRVEITIVEPPVPPEVTASASPESAVPGGEILLRIEADKALTAVEIFLPGLPPLSHPVRGKKAAVTVRIPFHRAPGRLEIAVKGRSEEGESKTITIEVEVLNPLRLEAVARPERSPLGGSISVEVKANAPLAGVEIFYEGGRLSLQGAGTAWSGRLRLPITAKVGPFVLLVAARGLEGGEATEELLVAVEPLLADGLQRIYPFTTDSAELRKEFHPILLQIAAILRANPGLKLRIIGHADATGTVDYNRGLSLRRAKAVKDFLVKRGEIAPGRLIVEGKGKEAPIAENNTGAERARNRRVEFVVVY